MARMLRMNSRHMAELCHNGILPSTLEQTFLLMGFAAETNLLKVSEGLGERDARLLDSAAERNAKLARLRVEIESQIALERKSKIRGAGMVEKLALMGELAAAFEEMGAQTVELAAPCCQIVRHSTPSRVSEIRKLMEHCVQITDATGAALIYEQVAWAKGALEQGRAAALLSERIERDLDLLRRGKPDSAARTELLEHAVLKTNQAIELIKTMATKVVNSLEETHVRV